MISKTGMSLQILKTAASVEELGVPGLMIEERSPRFLYFWARAVTADIENGNGDMFPLDELEKAYKTFVGRNLFLDHNTTSVASAVGKIVDAKLLKDEKTAETYVGALVKIDKQAHPDIALKIESGVIDSVSMGANVAEAQCNVCNAVMHTRDEFCTHMYHLGKVDPATGKKIVSINRNVTFTELSLVSTPADPDAKIREVFAKTNAGTTVVGSSNTTVTILGDKMTPEPEPVDSNIKVLLQKMTGLDFLNLSKLFKTAEPPFGGAAAPFTPKHNPGAPPAFEKHETPAPHEAPKMDGPKAPEHKSPMVPSAPHKPEEKKEEGGTPGSAAWEKHDVKLLEEGTKLIEKLLEREEMEGDKEFKKPLNEVLRTLKQLTKEENRDVKEKEKEEKRENKGKEKAEAPEKKEEKPEEKKDEHKEEKKDNSFGGEKKEEPKEEKKPPFMEKKEELFSAVETQISGLASTKLFRENVKNALSKNLSEGMSLEKESSAFEKQSISGVKEEIMKELDLHSVFMEKQNAADSKWLVIDRKAGRVLLRADLGTLFGETLKDNADYAKTKLGSDLVALIKDKGLDKEAIMSFIKEGKYKPAYPTENKMEAPAPSSHPKDKSKPKLETDKESSPDPKKGKEAAVDANGVVKVAGDAKVEKDTEVSPLIEGNGNPKAHENTSQDESGHPKNTTKIKTETDKDITAAPGKKEMEKVASSLFETSPTLDLGDGYTAKKEGENIAVLDSAGKVIATSPDIFTTNAAVQAKTILRAVAQIDRRVEAVSNEKQLKAELGELKMKEALREKMAECKTLVEMMVTKGVFHPNEKYLKEALDSNKPVLDAKRIAFAKSVEDQVKNFLAMDNISLEAFRHSLDAVQPPAKETTAGQRVLETPIRVQANDVPSGGFLERSKSWPWD